MNFKAFILGYFLIICLLLIDHWTEINLAHDLFLLILLLLFYFFILKYS